MTRLIIYAFSKRWGWLAAGLIVLAFGGVLFAQAHVVVPKEVSGTLTSAQDISQNNSYDHTEVQLAGDSNTYTFNKNDMSPAGVIDGFYKDGKVDIWIDQGSTTVVAIQLYGQNNDTPTKYVTDVYNHPDHALSTGRTNGEIIGGIGALLVLIGLAWPVFPWGRKKAAARQPAMVGAGSRTQATIQNAYSQQPAQQSGWPQQPHQPPYGPPSQYGAPNQPAYPPQPGQYGSPGAQSGWGQQSQQSYGPTGDQRSREPDQGGWGR